MKISHEITENRQKLKCHTSVKNKCVDLHPSDKHSMQTFLEKSILIN